MTKLPILAAALAAATFAIPAFAAPAAAAPALVAPAPAPAPAPLLHRKHWKTVCHYQRRGGHRVRVCRKVRVR